MEPVATGLTYDDLVALPDDGLRHELIHGEHFVTPAPRLSHQQVSVNLTEMLLRWRRQHGGRLFYAPTDVRFADDTVLEPDVLVIAPGRPELVADDRFVSGAPDLVVEISSPSTRRYDLVRKRRAYEEFGVGEFWFVDLDARRVEVYVLGGSGRYGAPRIVGEDGQVHAAVLPDLAVDVEAIFADPPVPD